VVRALIVVSILLALPALSGAQDATLTGTVKDSSGGVLPGVTITALHEASGNTFVAVTDAAGTFRLPVRTGSYRLSVELPGFATLVRAVNLLLGQIAALDLQMSPSSVQESVTVTGEAPLIDTQSSVLAGNIDPKQMQELPINGRNWMDLAMLAPGSRQNQSSGVPLLRQGYSQINIDGQQVTNNYIGIGDDQPRFSRDSIAEFEVITNRFDATQGRSAGMIANAITKSGTNVFSGGVSGYFRDDSLNAADKVQNVVLPYSNQQISTQFGGPIVKDRVHFFANYEREREPQVLVFAANGALAAFNMNIPAPRTQYIWGLKGDVQFSPSNRLSIRGNGYDQEYLSGGGATSHPSTGLENQRFTKQVQGVWTMVLSNNMVNVVKSGYSNFNRNNHSLAGYKGGPNPDVLGIPSFGWGAPPRVTFTGYSVGAVVQHHNQDLSSVRDDLSLSFDARGRHDVKTGAEFIYNLANLVGCGSLCTPRLIAQGASAANSAALLRAAFPVWNDTATWNLNALAPIATRYEASFTDIKGFYRTIPQDTFGIWMQDDWKVAQRLTLNLGVRYDYQNHVGQELNLPPFLPGPKTSDRNNVAPRLGAAYTINDRTVVRGGYGIFFAQGTQDEAHQTILYQIGASPLIPYDGRADFPTNPFPNGTPTFSSVLANSCDLNNNRPGCIVRQFIPEINSPFWEMPYSHQASIGMERQFGTAMSFQSNVVYTGGRNEEFTPNINLGYDPVTGINYNGNDAARRPLSQFGPVQMSLYSGRSNYYGWENAFTRRMLNHLQASVTYTLSKFKDATHEPWLWYVDNGHLQRKELGFTVAPDMGGEYTLAATDQRHRAVFNGIYEAPLGLQVSGVYFYGSGLRFGTSVGGDPRAQLAGGESRYRATANAFGSAGSIVARNTFVGKPIHRLDMRLQKHVRLGGRAGLDGILELFNVFDHANYGSYTTQESSASYGLPAFNNNVSYGPRALQIGFRVAF
jgi:hypothetical protein